MGGQLEERLTQQYYDEEYQQFLADRYITGECPKCGHPEAYGDQCEKCGASLSPAELINPKSTLSGKTPVLKETKHWYFRLDKHADWLRTWLQDGVLDGRQHHDPNTWRNHVVGQCLAWLNDKEGLQPRSITRDLDWGVPVPLPEAKGKVLYVWFDAPIGYISSTRQWALEKGKNWEEYWKGDQVNLIHFIGKDNIVFHCIIFPAMLKAHGDYALPVNVPANQFLNYEGRKFSKSRGWGIEQHEYLEEFAAFPNKEDALRWALTRTMPENKDSDFKWDEFSDYHDKDLADNLGNFINRVVVLTNNYFGGKVPASPEGHADTLEPVKTLASKLTAELDSFNFRNAAALLMEISSWGNTYLQDCAPWAARKTDPEAPIIAESLYNSIQIVALLSGLTQPFIPFSSEKIRKLLGLPALQNGELKTLLEAFAEGKALLPTGHQLGKPEILFAKIHDRKDDSRLKIIERQKQKLEAVLAAEKASQRPALKPEIQYEDFAKLDIRTATILAAEPIPKADKLLKLTVDLGFEQRTVVSGIAQHFKPEDLPGKKVLLLANLAPRKLRGVMSQGMVLMAEDAEGRLSFVSPQEELGNGWEVR